MADAFKDMYSSERDLRTTERVLAEHKLRKWQIATAAASITAAMLGVALAVRGASARRAIEPIRDDAAPRARAGR